LETAGYITVAFVGLRLLLKVLNDSFVPPQWAMVVAIAAVFAWGFSRRKAVEVGESTVEDATLESANSAQEIPSEVP
jgi:predicted tellurium resistance membrane protein TerC